ncbi:tetratricopeptide repeat-containing response regulator [Idiomarina aminovorans]|uniref:tetratricopeptide repeat-containing response regulator n=1 Tax=Idiomarina aminovorans TaxID=2914829 RepID=UPI002004639B|nr:tetratricopeptide repeat-containing response regulator [Idiomarina sp. ATCH4]MCK7460118.1 response regulator [Idiomarina sp. ATCH4]
MDKTLELNNKRVLLIDDQKPFQVMLQGLLLNLGAKDVQVKTTGEAGITAYIKNPHDILLVDYNLGRGRNGRQVLEELQTRGLMKEHTLFFIITGDNSRPMVLSALELQPDDYLMKPFSQRVLRSRLVRAYKRRMWLKDVFKALTKHDYEACINACQRHIQSNSRYSNYCRKLQIELYNKTGQLDKAETEIKELLEDNSHSWVFLKLAETRLLQNSPEEALNILNHIIKRMPNAIEAHDLKTECYVQQQLLEEALESARDAITLAPFSIERQTKLAHLARGNGDFDIAKQAMNNVLQIARKSVFRNAHHLCNYLRSILDAAENSDTPQQISKYQTEATMELQRARYDEHLLHADISFEDLEAILLSRIDSFNGRLREAQHRLNEVVGESLAKDQPINKDLLPDVIAILLDVGEYEKANKLAAYKDDNLLLDDYTAKILQARVAAAKKQQNSFFKTHKAGTEAYQEASYNRALELFKNAMEIAPMNSGAALNFIQAAVRFIEENPKAARGRLKNECDNCFKVLEGLQLSINHSKRYERLLQQTEELELR